MHGSEHHNPCFYEVTTIEEILTRVASVPLAKELIVVDDFSTDGTREKLDRLAGNYNNLRVIYHEKNKGKVVRSEAA